MGLHTEIQWCDSTVNASSGCDGCELWNLLRGIRNCYAGAIHEGRLAKSLPDLYAPDFTEVRLVPGRMARMAGARDLTGTARPDKPWLDGMPRTIFVGDMADLFSRAVPFEFIRDEVIATAASPKGSRHIWMLLTKQAGKAAEFGRWLVEDQGIPWPANVWQGVSVTSKVSAYRAVRMAGHPAPVKYLSVEPLLEAVEFDPAVLACYRLMIVGGESGKGARPFDLAWARDLHDQCRYAGVPFFLKQIGAQPFDSRLGNSVPDQKLYPRDSHGGDPSEWPVDLRVRDFPALKTEAA